MTLTANHKPRTETGILRCQEETAVSSYKILILEQQERIAELEADLANANERFLDMTNIAMEALAEFASVSGELSRLRAQNERLHAALQTAWAALGREAE